MEELKWQFKLFRHYFRMNMKNQFSILGKRQNQWIEIFKI